MGLLALCALIFIAWQQVNQIERTITSGELAADLLNDVLEVRQMENIFLLSDSDSTYKEVMARALTLSIQAEQIREALPSPAHQQVGISQQVGLNKLNNGLTLYLSMLSKVRDATGAEHNTLKTQIRAAGDYIMYSVRGIWAGQRKSIKDTLSAARTHRRKYMVLIAALTALTGILIYRMLIPPLKTLELHLNEAAEGRYALPSMPHPPRELLALKEALNRMDRELQEGKACMTKNDKLSSMGTLLFGVAHELKNPISNISTTAQILREEDNEGKADFRAEMIDQIDEGVHRAQGIIDSLLEYSRSENMKIMSLQSIVMDTMTLLRGSIPADVHISVSIAQDIMILAEKQRMQQVFLNLTANAIDSIGEAGQVTIQASPVTEDGKLRITVNDTGAGIDPEIAEDIFKPFVTGKAGAKGYGMGLFMTSTIIKEHGGTITASSRPGHGTSFVMEFPLQER